MIPKVLQASDWMWCNTNSGCHCNSGQKQQNWLIHFHWLFARIGCVCNISLIRTVLHMVNFILPIELSYVRIYCFCVLIYTRMNVILSTISAKPKFGCSVTIGTVCS